MKLNRILMLLGMLLILPSSVLAVTQVIDDFNRAPEDPVADSPSGIVWGASGTGCQLQVHSGQDALYCSGRASDEFIYTSGGLGNTSVYRINYSVFLPSSSVDGTISFWNDTGSSSTLIFTHSWSGDAQSRGSYGSPTQFASITVGQYNDFVVEFNATGNQYRINSTTSSESSGWINAENNFNDVRGISTQREHSGGNNGQHWIDYFYSSYTAGVPPNTNPTITQIANQVIFEDTNLTGINFTIGDAEDIITNLNVTATSSNAGLVPNANLFLSTLSADMTINATPLADQFGNTTINITVTDTGGLTNSTAFNLEVLNVNDPPIITNVTNKVMVESSTITIPFNVTDIDNLYTELSYEVGFTNASRFTNYTFTNNDGTAQNLTLTADALYGLVGVNLIVSDGEYQDSTVFDVTVNCNTTIRYNTTFPLDEAPACYSVTATYDENLDILNYTWIDFGGTVDNNWLFVYRTTGGMNEQISYVASANISGEWIFNYSANYPNDNFRILGYMSDSNRTFIGGVTDINVIDLLVDQSATLNTFFSKSDGLIYSVLIMILFLTIGVASQSATMTLILSVLALFISSKFVLNIPTEMLWVTGAVILILIWFIAKLRVD